ncbi:CvfB family protein [Vagococcus hydrophili]|uniref:DNA-binding protein n=1 Tax=Vagococcus hydrophili TaxID=2714947 RepID=A0A6G8AWK6_9ENTE|nr:S1-like domain-containing RNA-binding protein [Vagococcus hydrophili]QIL49376.1 DNA-binding protein [Vagococcus hydrophili]
MNELIGSVWLGMIFDENDHSYFVQKNGITFLLAKEEGQREIGDMVEGFAYQNQKQQNVFTTTLPSVRKDHQEFAEVIASRKDLGVFVDIGLKDKEIVVSLDELPEMRNLWPKKGDQLLVSLKVDEKDRLWATIADDVEFLAMSHAGTAEEMHNKNVTGIVYRLKLVGTFFITDEKHIGFIHPSERFEEPRLGERVTGRVIGVRPDGVINVSLKPRSHEVISSDAQMILTFLERSEEGKINFSDKSTPEEIQTTFAISKGQFKRALGSLMKARMITQEDGWTILVKK